MIMMIIDFISARRLICNSHDRVKFIALVAVI